MASTDFCPPEFVWQRILVEGALELAVHGLAPHLEQCPQCQAIVTRLVGPERSWNSAAEELREKLAKRNVATADPEAPLPDYKVEATPQDHSPHLLDYVRTLEEQARKERKKKPYHRRRFPVNLVAGLVLILCGLLILLNAFRVTEGMMSSLINGLLPACIFFLLGAACLIFAGK